MPQIARIVGGAGTGKTSRLLDLMAKSIEAGEIGPEDIGFVSFTRAARGEASGRAAERFGVSSAVLEAEWFKTLHAICYKVLGVGKELLAGSVADQKWLDEAIQERCGSSGGDDEGMAAVAFESSTEAGAALSMWAAARNRLEPLSATWERADRIDDRTPSLEYCREIVERYEQAKRLDGRSDFVDLLGRFAGWKFYVDGPRQVSPEGYVPAVDVWFLDEQQDASALLDSVCRRLIEPSRWVYVVGDVFQCQPPDTLVLTTKGYKRIDEIDPARDRLPAYHRHSAKMIGYPQPQASVIRTGDAVPISKGDGPKYKRGFSFEKAFRPYKGDLISIAAGGQLSRSTPNHKWLVKWINKDRRDWCVYLMRQGTRWRVGMCHLFSVPDGGNNDGTLKLRHRVSREKADAAWILKTFATRREAAAYEKATSETSGIPTILFSEPKHGKKFNLTQENIDATFAAIDPEELGAAAKTCLTDHGRLIEFPLLDASGKTPMARVSEVQACNLLPEFMAVPRWIEKSVTKWVPIESVEREAYDGLVYSLDVDRHHTYVADGLVTCNSIYGWAGSDAKHFMSWEVAKQEIMPVSYRCPKNILELGESILRECSDYWDRGIQPAASGGDIERVGLRIDEISSIDPRDSWLLLARSNYHARRLAAMLDERGIPWAPTRGAGGWVRPTTNLGLLSLYYLEQGLPIDVRHWKLALKLLPSRMEGTELLTRGTKKRFEDMSDGETLPIQLAMLEEVGATESLKTTLANKSWRQIVERADRFCQAVEAYGDEAATNPSVKVGTIHSVKGAEADNVLLLTSTSRQVARSMEDETGADEERRVGYVAVTRARKRLIVADDRSEFKMEIPT